MIKLNQDMMDGAQVLLNHNQEIECTVTTSDGAVDCYIDGIYPEGIYVCRQIDRQRSWEPFLPCVVRISSDTAELLMEALKQFGKPDRSYRNLVGEPILFNPYSDRPAEQLVQRFLQKRQAA